MKKTLNGGGIRRARLELFVLGSVRSLYDERDVTEALPRKAQALLCYVAVSGETQARPAIA